MGLLATSSPVPARSPWLELAVIRPRQWMHFALLPLLAVNPSAPVDANHLRRIGLAILCASAALGWAYGLNAIGDRSMDRSSEKNPLVGMSVVPAGALAAVGAVGLVALLSGVALGLFAGSLMLVCLVAGAAYSVGPRMKARPFVGLLFNLCIFVPLAGLLASPGVAPAAHFPLLLLVFLAMLIQSQLLHELQDWQEDSGAGLCTTAVFLGRPATRTAAAAVVIPSLILVARLPAPPLLTIGASLALVASAAPPFLTRFPAFARDLHRRLCVVLGGLLLTLGWALERLG